MALTCRSKNLSVLFKSLLKIPFKILSKREFPGVQCSGLGALTARAWVQPLGRELRYRKPQSSLEDSF